MYAAEASDVDKLAELLTKGCDIDINARDYDGCTSLALATEKGHTEVVERLLAHNANPNLSDLDQVTPLWKAARYGHTPVVRLLLASEKLLDVNLRPAYLHKYKLDTPLSIALKEGHQETAELLSCADAINPCLTTAMTNDDDKAGYLAEISILGLAINGTFENVALSLMHKCNIGHGSQDADGNGTKDSVEPASKLLVLGAAAGCSRVVTELLNKYGADVNAIHEYYAGVELRRFTDSPLMAASRRGDLNAVRSLLNMDEIRPGVASEHSGTALTAAAQGGFIDVVRILIADGRIEVGYKNGDGRTAVSYAAESGSVAVLDELLATGAVNPNGEDSQARTPLIWAVDPGGGYGPTGWQAYEGVVRRLLAHSQIAVNAKNSYGRTALLYAARNGALGLVMALLEHPQIDLTAGPEDTSPLAEAATYGHADVVQALISIGLVDVNTVLARLYERTALMAVVEYGRVEYESATQVLLSSPGIDVNFQDRNGRTALMLAASGGTVGMVKLILAAGGNPNIQDNKGNTALSYARNVEKFKALLKDPGIKPDLPSNVGRTALSIAVEAGEIDYVSTLLASDDINPDARDIHGRSPLLWVFGKNALEDSSKKEERKAILKQLLRIPDVDPNAEDHEGFTPLLLAIMSHQGHEYVEVLFSRSDLDVNRPPAKGLGSPFDTARQIGNVATMALLRTRGATESVDSVRPRSLESNFVIEEGRWPGAYSMFQETLPQRRRSSSHGSSTTSDEPDFEYQPGLTNRLIDALRASLLKEYPLHLGEQQEYVDGW
ncbi:hypothetical protein FNYG_05270 [Fusarium nygamai]|uniref:Uncharacterized protein n=1 Tax=Gibberella nygamai TaxID=42673 RepID=A0A2K0WG32_GIBNY|nr:hypothetical protein FNYG_05270 [Fusarium nygamai]